MKGFLNFIREQGAVGLAVGFILGGAVSDLVKSIIDNIINPILGILLNNVKGVRKCNIRSSWRNYKVWCFHQHSHQLLCYCCGSVFWS